MIDGEWGCGKTHYVKESLIKQINAHEQDKEKDRRRKVVYISLYGIDSVEEISKQIIVTSYLEGKDKIKGLIQTGTKIAGTVLSIVTKDISIDSISEKLEAFLPIINSILIFDDLERCTFTINEVMGYINSFVEQDGMKVIVVANEKEIGHSTFQDNQELKYLLALHPGIEFKGNTRKDVKKRIKQALNGSSQREPQQSATVDTNELHGRIEELFGQNETYEKVKEKLIGNTIHYHPNLKKAFEILINGDSVNADLRAILKDKLSLFEEYMIDESHTNLRTFQFYLSKIQDLFELINTLNGEGRVAFLNYIVIYCFKICVSYKSGMYEYTWTGNEEHGFQRIGSRDIFGGQLNLRFVDDFIIGSQLDLDRAKQMLELYEIEYVRRDSRELDALRKLELSWFVSSDKDIETEIEIMMKALEEDKYPLESYTRIVNMLLRLEEVGFSGEYVSSEISKMKTNINKTTEYIYLARGFSLDSESNNKEQHARIMDELQVEMDKRFQEKTTNDIDQFLTQEDGWGAALYEYVQKTYQTVAKQIGFLSNLSISDIILKLKKSNASDLNAFRSCIIFLYTQHPIESALRQDGTRLVTLKDRIEKTDISALDKIQKMQMGYLVKNLNQAINVYDHEEPEL